MHDFELAEDVLQEALESALVHWARNGLPASPGRWLLLTARRKAIDRIRRARNFDGLREDYSRLMSLEEAEAGSEASHAILDERLRLIFTCCHPSLDDKVRIALTLHTLGGLTTGEISRAFVVSEQTMAQRLVRAKRKIKLAGIPYQVPEPEDWDERLGAVLGVLYLIFNEGYAASRGRSRQRADLSNEAFRLAGLLQQLRPEEPEIEGFIALMLLHSSRKAARDAAGPGGFIPLEEQDRTLWNRDQIASGVELLERAMGRGSPGPYQIQAAISAIHAEAASHRQTGWEEIVGLYEELYRLQPNPVVLLNRAVALSYMLDAHRALVDVEKLSDQLAHYQPYHAVCADLLCRVGREADAREAYAQAIGLSRNDAERQFLQRRESQLDSG